MRFTTDAAKTVTSSNSPNAFGVGSVTSGTASAFSWNAKSGYRQDGVAPTGISSAYSFQKVGDRYYDPTLMCFLTRDTELDELPYTYCGGDPVNCTDPDGHKIKRLQDLGKWLSGLFGGGVSGTVKYKQTGPTETFRKDPTIFHKEVTMTTSPNGTVTKTYSSTTTRGGVTITKTGPTTEFAGKLGGK